MALLQSTTISGSNANTGSLSITGSTMIFPVIESSLTSSFSGSGKMWVNADGQALQYTVQTSLGTVQSPASFMGAWSNGGAMSIARHAIGAGGTQNAAILFGGRTNSNTDSTEEYDGTSWSAGGDLITARAWLQGAGEQNAALAISGYVNAAVSCVEEYNGASWSSGGNVINARFDAGGAGFSQTPGGAGSTGHSGQGIDTPGGGGGGAGFRPSPSAAAGGSGIVIIRYKFQ